MLLKQRGEPSRGLDAALVFRPALQLISWPSGWLLAPQTNQHSPAHQQLDLKVGGCVRLLQAVLSCSKTFTKLLLEV